MSNELPFNSIESRLAQLRTEFGYTIQGVADKINVTRKTYRTWETGTYANGGTSAERAPVQIKAESLLALSDLYGVSVDYLLCRTKYRAINGKAIADTTGLSDKAVNILQQRNGGTERNAHPAADIVSALLSDYEDNGGESLLMCISSYLGTQEGEITINRLTGRQCPATVPGAFSVDLDATQIIRINSATVRMKDKLGRDKLNQK